MKSLKKVENQQKRIFNHYNDCLCNTSHTKLSIYITVVGEKQHKSRDIVGSDLSLGHLHVNMTLRLITQGCIDGWLAGRMDVGLDVWMD